MYFFPTNLRLQFTLLPEICEIKEWRNGATFSHLIYNNMKLYHLCNSHHALLSK